MARHRGTDVQTLTPDQRDELLYGRTVNLASSHEDARGATDDPFTFFQNHDAARWAWELHRRKLMEEWNHVGQRPRGWWMYEAEEPVPPPGKEAERLRELGELTSEEESALKEKAVPP